jgi:hypothetical protein
MLSAMKRLLYGVVLLAGFLCVPTSCTEEQDFSQIDDLSITPVLASGLFYLESDEATINSGSSGGPFYTREVIFEAFSQDYVAERLLEGTITYEMENTTSKPVRVLIEFLNAGGTVLDMEVLDISAEPSGLVTRDVFYGPGGKSLDILVNTERLRISALNLGDTSSTSSVDDPKIILRSGAEFLFELK